MESVNIVCVGLSKALYGILEASFSKEKSLWVMGNFETLDTPLFFQNEQPEIIITESAPPNIFPDALYRFPHAKIVTIEKQGKNISVWRLSLNRQDLGEISSDELAAVITSLGKH